MHMLEISAKLQNTEISPVTLLKNVSITDTHPTISKNSRNTHGKFLQLSQFQYGYGGWIEQVELLKRNTTENIFLNFLKLPKKFSRISSFVKSSFLESNIFLVSSCNPIALIE